MPDEQFMQLALKQARLAYAEDEIPIGAVIVKNNTILASAHNTNRASNNPTRHAEIIAIEEAAAAIKNERLIDCDLYVTKEPCSMCAGAIVDPRIKRIFIAAADIKYGACGSKFSVCGNPNLNHVPEIIFGLCQKDAADLLSNFFQDKRRK